MFLKVTGLILVLVFVGILPSSAEDESVKEPLVGGPCDYKHYEGLAKITSINQRADSGNGYEVKFSFQSDQEIDEPYAQTEGREFLLLTKNGSYPGATFLEKNGIEVGSVLDCTLNVIVRGACTPIIFEFPSIMD